MLTQAEIEAMESRSKACIAEEDSHGWPNPAMHEPHTAQRAFEDRAALLAELAALRAEHEMVVASWKREELDWDATEKALRARVAELEAERDEAVNWIFGSEEEIGLLDTTDGYYQWSLDPRAKRLNPKLREVLSAGTAPATDERLAHGTGPDVLEHIAQVVLANTGPAMDQVRGHLMDAATLIRTLQKRNEDLANEFLRTGPRQEPAP